jgi:hypothetical protein
VQRPSLNKVLRDLERDGLISISYSAIDILDLGKLARLAKYARHAKRRPGPHHVSEPTNPGWQRRAPGMLSVWIATMT